MTNVKKTSFGDFLTQLASRAENQGITAMALENVKKKLEAEKAEKVEAAIRQFHNRMQSLVADLRRIRKREKLALQEIKNLEETVDNYIAGKVDEHDSEL